MPSPLRNAAYYPDSLTNPLRVKISQDKFDMLVDGVKNGSFDQPSDAFQAVTLSTSKRSIRLRPRYVTFTFDGVPPAGFKSGVVLKVVILSASIWDKAVPGVHGTYLNAQITFVDRYREDG